MIARLFGFFICCQFTTFAAVATTNLLEIRLIDQDVKNLAIDSLDLKKLTLSLQPILSDVDFRSYKTNGHEFTITASATRRLARALWKRSPSVDQRNDTAYYELCGPDTPFVLVALGKPIYVGVFSNPNSSRFYLVPTVKPADLIRFDVHSTNDISFTITMNTVSTNASEHIKAPLDKRNDPKILAAFKSLGV